jgi:hypothetical protein
LIDLETKTGWFSDPYDPDCKAPFLSNIADREEYDERFPKHPLSRARNTLEMLKENIKFSDDIINSPEFFTDFK